MFKLASNHILNSLMIRKHNHGMLDCWRKSAMVHLWLPQWKKFHLSENIAQTEQGRKFLWRAKPEV